MIFDLKYVLKANAKNIVMKKLYNYSYSIKSIIQRSTIICNSKNVLTHGVCFVYGYTEHLL